MRLICREEFTMKQVYRYLTMINKREGTLGSGFVNWLGYHNLLSPLPQKYIKVTRSGEEITKNNTVTVTAITHLKMPVVYNGKVCHLVFFHWDPGVWRHHEMRYGSTTIVHLVEDLQKDIKSRHNFLYNTKTGMLKVHNPLEKGFVTDILSHRIAVKYIEKSKNDLNKCVLRLFREQFMSLEDAYADHKR